VSDGALPNESKVFGKLCAGLEKLRVLQKGGQIAESVRNYLLTKKCAGEIRANKDTSNPLKRKRLNTLGRSVPWSQGKGN